MLSFFVIITARGASDNFMEIYVAYVKTVAAGITEDQCSFKLLWRRTSNILSFQANGVLSVICQCSACPHKCIHCERVYKFW